MTVDDSANAGLRMGPFAWQLKRPRPGAGSVAVYLSFDHRRAVVVGFFVERRRHGLVAATGHGLGFTDAIARAATVRARVTDVMSACPSAPGESRGQ